MAITTCQFLGIYVEEIERAAQKCEDAMEKLGFSIDEIDDMNDYAKQELDEEWGGIDGITNRIIGAYFRAAEYMIHERFPSLGVDYYVNGYCSSFEVDELQHMDEEDIRADWEAALNTMEYGEIAKEIGWGFTDEDLQELIRLHKAGICRQQIEDLLTDCNFHTECADWHDGNYVLRDE